VIDCDATNFQRHARLKCVRVPAAAYSHAHSFLSSSGPVLQIKLCQFQIAGMGDFQIRR